MGRTARSILWTFVAASLAAACTPRVRVEPTPVASVERSLAELPALDVADVERFLNDLKLSPYWCVTRNRDGGFEAKRRDPTAGQPPSGPRDPVWLVSVLDHRPTRPEVAFATREQGVVLKVHDGPGDGGRIGPNSSSLLALPISNRSPLHLVMGESGDDPGREATFARLPVVLKELAAIASDPGDYRVEERHRELFLRLFPEPRGDHALVRIEGSQGRDTFHGYLRSRPGTSYEGVSLRISSPQICQGECTSDVSRLRKAEYLGVPYHDGDLLYFRIGDNAVYLNEHFSRRYGWFSGDERFEANIELLNPDGFALIESRGLFAGWER